MDKVEQVLTSLISSLPEATMAAMLGMDGVAVQIAFSDAWQDQDVDPEIVQIELAALANGVQRAASGLEAGMSPEFFLGTAQANFLGAMLDPSYFLVLGLQPYGDLERAREALQQARENLEDRGNP